MGRGRAAPREAPEGEKKGTKGGGFPVEKTQADGYRGGSEGSEGRSATVWKGGPLGGGEGGGSWTSLGGPGGRREAEKEGDMEEKGRGEEGLGRGWGARMGLSRGDSGGPPPGWGTEGTGLGSPRMGAGWVGPA